MGPRKYLDSAQDAYVPHQVLVEIFLSSISLGGKEKGLERVEESIEKGIITIWGRGSN